MKMCENANINTQSTADYLAQLLKDKKQLVAFPNVFIHVERLLDEEVGKVRSSLFQINGTKKEPLVLPEAEGPNTTLSEKVYVPVKEHPDFNFVGRILGPRGMTAKQLEQETGCKIMVRGKGSMRDKKKEEQNRGKPNWEHLNDELHVLITVEDTENRAKVKLQRAVEEVKKLLVPVVSGPQPIAGLGWLNLYTYKPKIEYLTTAVKADGEDELKKRQLMELAIINGTYRDSSAKAIAGAVSEDDWRRLALVAAETQRLLGGPGGGGGGGAIPGMGPPMRPPTAPLGAPLILSPRIPVPTSSATMLNGSGPPHPPPPPPLLSAADAAAAAAGLIYTPYPTAADYANYAALASPLLAEYASAAAADHHAGGAAKQRRHMGQFREHPYQRAGALS